MKTINAYKTLLKNKTDKEVENIYEKIIYKNYKEADFREDPNEILKTIDKLLKPYKLGVEILDDESDTYWFRIIKLIIK